MKKLLKTGYVCLVCASFLTTAYADQTQMNQTLVQAIQQLQQIKPLIAQAAQEEPQDMQSTVHLTAFVGPDGQTQNGVMEDIDALQSGIEQIINLQQIDPRSYTPISGDYVGEQLAMITFGMNAQQAAAANAAMSNGTTYTSFHILIMSLTAFLLVSFILACLITGYNHFAENEIPLDKFVKLIIFLAVLFIGFAIFLVV